jgi:predicted transcriptional regulator
MARSSLVPEHENPDAAAFRRAVAEGLASLDAGRGVPYEDVRRWLLSWGTESELPPPECK